MLKQRQLVGYVIFPYSFSALYRFSLSYIVLSFEPFLSFLRNFKPFGVCAYLQNVAKIHVAMGRKSKMEPNIDQTTRKTKTCSKILIAFLLPVFSLTLILAGILITHSQVIMCAFCLVLTIFSAFQARIAA